MAGNTRLWAILTALAGIAVLAVTVGFTLLPEVAAGKAAGCYASTPPVIPFEFARTASEAAGLFGFGECTPRNLAAMDAINRFDMAAYIPAYTLFAVFAAVFAARGARPPLVLAAIITAIVALAADYIETTTLLDITARLDAATDDMTTRSSTAAWIKFWALAAHGLLVAGVCFRASPRRWIMGAALLLPLLGTIAAAVDTARFTPLMNLGLMIGWTVTLLMALKESVLPAKGG